MRKQKKLLSLLVIFIVICVATIVVSNYQKEKENIKTSGEVVFELDADNVKSLSWTNSKGTYSFTKDDIWIYDEDKEFSVSEEKIKNLLSQFEKLQAAFVIEDVEDYSLYGLDDPICTINIVTDEDSYVIKLGDYSKMDKQRYLTINDELVYLVDHDPLDEYKAVLKDMILDDEIPKFDIADKVVFSQNENYTIIYDEEIESLCEDDVYFVDNEPLDTDNVNNFLNNLKEAQLEDYVTYNVSSEQLSEYGFDDPDLIINMDYSSRDRKGNIEDSGSIKITIARNVEEVAAYNEAVEKEKDKLPDVTCYIRINDSKIIYEISQDTYDDLTNVAYDTLRHQELFTADFDIVTAINVTLEDEDYSFMSSKEDDDVIWTYLEEEFEIKNIKNAIEELKATSFTDEKASGQKEISITLTLENEDFTIELYRYDGSNCLAKVNGKTIALVARSQAVDLMEAVNELVLKN